ncbi:unnamed protein product [Ectocarpus sp. 4 AP-2014]
MPQVWYSVGRSDPLNDMVRFASKTWTNRPPGAPGARFSPAKGLTPIVRMKWHLHYTTCDIISHAQNMFILSSRADSGFGGEVSRVLVAFATSSDIPIKPLVV